MAGGFNSSIPQSLMPSCTHVLMYSCTQDRVGEARPEGEWFYPLPAGNRFSNSSITTSVMSRSSRAQPDFTRACSAAGISALSRFVLPLLLSRTNASKATAFP